MRERTLPVVPERDTEREVGCPRGRAVASNVGSRACDTRTPRLRVEFPVRRAATSQAVQDMLDVRETDFGFLTHTMEVADASIVSISGASLIQPRAEAEIAFYLSQDLKGPGLTAEDVLDATAEVGACFEIADSRIRDWKIRIQDTLADNASRGVHVLGRQRVAPRSLDLAAAAKTMCKNEKVVATGLGSAVQGHPAQAVPWLANTLGAEGFPSLQGEVILSGSLAALFPATAGDRFSMELGGIGTGSIGFSA